MGQGYSKKTNATTGVATVGVVGKRSNTIATGKTRWLGQGKVLIKVKGKG